MSSPSSDILAASYSFKYKLGITSLVAAAGIIAAATAIMDRSGPDPMFTTALCLFAALSFWLLLNIWRKRVLFQGDRIFVRGPLRAVWRTYDEIVSVARQTDSLDLKFRDGGKASINRHMADLAAVRALVAARSPGLDSSE